MNIRKTAIIVGILILVAYTMLLSTSVAPIVGLFTEVLSGAAVIGIAVLMFPVLNPYKLRIPFFVLKAIEGILMFAAGVFILLKNIKMYDNIYSVHVYAFSISAFFLYILLFQKQLVAKYICIWGMFASVSVLSANIYTQLGFELNIIGTIVGYMPIILNEVFLSFVLIIKGFKKEAAEWDSFNYRR